MKPIAALAAALRPNLIIVDSICGDLNFEEGGTPVQTNRMYLGTDAVQIDAYGCRLMGIDPADVPYIGLAERWGAGSTEIREDDIVTLNQPQSSRKYPANKKCKTGLCLLRLLRRAGAGTVHRRGQRHPLQWLYRHWAGFQGQGI